jgi:hypothetical protein
MVKLLKSLKQHAIRAFEQVFICILESNCFARHVPRHHTTDSYLWLWFLFLHWAYLESYQSLHVIKSMFTMALPREANPTVHSKESLKSLK